MSIYPELSYNDQKVEIQEVKGIQFSVLGPDEIIEKISCRNNIKQILMLVVNQSSVVYLILVLEY